MKLLVLSLFVFFTVSVSAQFSLSGKLRTLHPLAIKVCDLAGNTIVECPIESGKEFRTESVHIKNDLYLVYFGEYIEKIILTDNPVEIKGFLDDQQPENSSIEFEGIDLHMKYLEISGLSWIDGKGSKRDVFQCYAEDDAIDPIVRATLVHEKRGFLGLDYESYKRILDRIPKDKREAEVVKFLIREVADRKKYALGQEVYNFTFIDVNGKNVSLTDFRGKFVLLDFSASWCGGCRTEAKKLVSIYDELKGDDLVIITISLDNREKDWRRMVAEDKLPWISLWNREGFTKGNKPNKVQSAYGFYQIPFIVLIDKNGKIIARDLRGEKVKEAIEKARKMN